MVVKLNTLLTNVGYTPMIFSSQTAFEDYIRATDYSSNTQICFGITVQSSSSGSYLYSLRFEMTTDSTTDGPWTTLALSQDQAIDYTLYARTTGQGMVGANNMVHTAILQI